jgi:hypothetical protein
MSPAEILNLYAGAERDFALLLEDKRSSPFNDCYHAKLVCLCGDRPLWMTHLRNKGARLVCSYEGDPAGQDILVAATTESWRERLEQEHHIVIAARWGRSNKTQWLILKPDDSPGGLAMNKTYQWVPFDGEHDYAVFASLPEAIVAAVKALAAEKRGQARDEYMAKAKTIMGLDPATGPALTATITYTIVPENRIRAIVQEELAKTRKDPQ